MRILPFLAVLLSLVAACGQTPDGRRLSFVTYSTITYDARAQSAPVAAPTVMACVMADNAVRTWQIGVVQADCREMPKPLHAEIFRDRDGYQILVFHDQNWFEWYFIDEVYRPYDRRERHHYHDNW